MRFRQLEIFHAVMTSGTVTKAAKKLSVSQPSVTTSIQQMEEEIGFALFSRVSGRLSPTAEARVLFEEVNRAHDSLVAVKSLCHRLKDGAAGHIRIAATPAICQRVLPAAITIFQQHHKSFTFDISSEHSPVILSNLDERPTAYHMGFTFGQDGLDGIASILLTELPIVCAIPKQWLNKVSKAIGPDGKVNLAQLQELPFIELYENEPLGQRARSAWLASGGSPNNVVRVHDHHMAASLVNNAIGFAILDRLVINSIGNQDNQIAIFELASSHLLPVTAVFSQKRSLSYPMRYFVDCVKASINALLSQNLRK
ncbi:LysR family transcriptional regulator [Alkalimonas sp. MEB108]|uniref:LysR family transcriptional regulator n=1 Tax=Alkalimonas cellulosilytica TaxID=3058395 RepID=A0ABU7J8P9_9GAMM|nr:LysR family transcriptional regulator [Alkalimonas sp. MEB108]MEE2002889.1 LysR family transcriptional regulator [Alkalimonas sp. MEB108]